MCLHGLGRGLVQGFGLTFSDVKVGRLEFKGSIFTSSSGSLGHTCWGLLIILIV